MFEGGISMLKEVKGQIEIVKTDKDVLKILTRIIEQNSEIIEINKSVTHTLADPMMIYKGK